MSTSKRRAVDDVSEQGDALSLSGAPSPQHAVRTRGNCPCPMMSCACTGEFHSSTPPTAPKPEQICKVQKTTKASDVEQDMDQEGKGGHRPYHSYGTSAPSELPAASRSTLIIVSLLR